MTAKIINENKKKYGKGGSKLTGRMITSSVWYGVNAVLASCVSCVEVLLCYCRDKTIEWLREWLGINDLERELQELKQRESRLDIQLQELVNSTKNLRMLVQDLERYMKVLDVRVKKHRYTKERYMKVLDIHTCKETPIHKGRLPMQQADDAVTYLGRRSSALKGDAMILNDGAEHTNNGTIMSDISTGNECGGNLELTHRVLCDSNVMMDNCVKPVNRS
ncbi:MAG: hypothetical protein SGILL_004964 [Bacillariaceae sp.]